MMLSHDNYVWTGSSVEDEDYIKVKQDGIQIRMVSYLPLSHVAAQYSDIVLALSTGASVFFTDINALKGTLINYLLEIRPTIFLGVPRIYEKMEEKVRAILESKPLIFKWASQYGKEGNHALMNKQSPGIMYKLFEKLVYSKVKENLGLDQTIKFFSGAAPIPLRTREFFFNLGIFINNVFGMSETSGPMTAFVKEEQHDYDLRSAGKPIKGGEAFVLKSDPKSEVGELCFRGRNIFMGYLKNETATRETIDNERRVHSGDEGKINAKGVVFITGRIKELIVTAAGENVAPVPLETNIKEELPFIANVMALGDRRKYISAIFSFKVTSTPGELPNRILAPECIEGLAKFGIKGLKTVEEAMKSPEVLKAIQKGNIR